MSDLLKVGTEVTGNPQVDLAAQEAEVQKRVAAAVAEHEAKLKAQNARGALSEADILALLAKGQETRKDEPAPIKVLGQEFNSVADLEAQIQAALANAKAQAAEEARRTSAPVEKPKGYDEKEFEKLLAQEGGTPKALEYALRHSGIYQELEAVKAANAALRMQETARAVKELIPGYQPKNPQEIAVVDNIRQQMGGAPDNPLAWEAAVRVAAGRNLIKLEEPKVETKQSVATPPYLGGSPTAAPTAEQEALIRQAWALPLDQLERLRSDIAAARGGGY